MIITIIPLLQMTHMKKIIFLLLISLSVLQATAQIPKLTTTQVSALKTTIQKTSFSCYSLVKTEYRYIFDYIQNQTGTCDLNTALASLTMQVYDTRGDYVSSYTCTMPVIPGMIACSKIDLNNIKMRSNTGVETMFGGYLNPTTGRLATSLYLKSAVLTTDMVMRETSATIPNGKVFTGSVQSGGYQVSAVLTIRNICINIGG